MTEVVLRPVAELDIRLAAHRYEREEPRLGDRFTDELVKTIDRIASLPNQFPHVAPGTQRALVRVFPFAVYFVVEPDRIVVVGVFHQHDDPAKWQKRIRDRTGAG